MVNKNQWIFNAANILNSAAEAGHERATNSVFASAQLAWKEYLSMDLTARNDWVVHITLQQPFILLSICKLKFHHNRFSSFIRQDITFMAHICQSSAYLPHK